MDSASWLKRLSRPVFLYSVLAVSTADNTARLAAMTATPPGSTDMVESAASSSTLIKKNHNLSISKSFIVLQGPYREQYPPFPALHQLIRIKEGH